MSVTQGHIVLYIQEGFISISMTKLKLESKYFIFYLQLYHSSGGNWILLVIYFFLIVHNYINSGLIKKFHI